MNELRDDAFWDTPLQEPLAPRRGASALRKLAPHEERAETRGRARALQALYAADLRGMADLRRIAITVFDDLAVAPDERDFATRIIATVNEYGETMDRELAAVTENWRFNRLGAIERSVLRLAAAELSRGETPVKVVIQEAVRLAERYGTGRSARFINGVLDAHARKLWRL